VHVPNHDLDLLNAVHIGLFYVQLLKDGTTEEVKTEQPAEPQTEGDQVKSEEKQEEKPSEAPQGNYRDLN
jgi:hypothetical protein